jgi:Na+/serine symporter
MKKEEELVYTQTVTIKKYFIGIIIGDTVSMLCRNENNAGKFVFRNCFANMKAVAPMHVQWFETKKMAKKFARKMEYQSRDNNSDVIYPSNFQVMVAEIPTVIPVNPNKYAGE